MGLYEIVNELAKARRVEQIIRTICRPYRTELKDLAQIIYTALLEKDNGVVQELWRDGGIDGAINFYLVRMVKNQHDTNHSTYRDLFHKYDSRAINIQDGELLAQLGVGSIDIQADKG